MAFFTDITYEGQPAQVGPTFKRTAPRINRDGTQDVTHGFAIKRGAMLEYLMFNSPEEATMARDALLGNQPEQPDTEYRDRVVNDLLSRHITATVSPPDAHGNVKIVADAGAATYTVDVDGNITEAAQA